MAHGEPKPLCSGAPMCIMLLLSFIYAQGNPDVEIVGCLESYYLSNKTCHSCPEQCKTCISNDNCTTCAQGYFGKICKLTCEQPCSGQCHQETGHCTLGCPDGQFPEPNSPACLYCKEQCILCSSRSQCVKCETGLFGPTCSEICPDHCKDNICHQNGTCQTCSSGYYKDSDGKCIECPDGCLRCVNATICSECIDGRVGPYSGNCMLQCSTELRALPYFESSDRNDCVKEGYCINMTLSQDLINIKKDLCHLLMYQKCHQECLPCEQTKVEGIMCSEGYTCTDSCKVTSPSFDSEPMQLCRDNISHEAIIASIKPPTYSCHTNTDQNGFHASIITTICIISAICLICALGLVTRKRLNSKQRQQGTSIDKQHSSGSISVPLIYNFEDVEMVSRSRNSRNIIEESGIPLSEGRNLRNILPNNDKIETTQQEKTHVPVSHIDAANAGFLKKADMKSSTTSIHEKRRMLPEITAIPQDINNTEQNSDIVSHPKTSQHYTAATPSNAFSDKDNEVHDEKKEQIDKRYSGHSKPLKDYTAIVYSASSSNDYTCCSTSTNADLSEKDNTYSNDNNDAFDSVNTGTSSREIIPMWKWKLKFDGMKDQL